MTYTTLFRLLFSLNAVFVGCVSAMETVQNDPNSVTPAIGGDAISELSTKIASIKAYLKNPSFRSLITKADFELHKQELIKLEKRKALTQVAQNPEYKEIKSVEFLLKHHPQPSLLGKEFKDDVVSLCEEVVSLDSYLSNPDFKRFETENDKREILDRLFTCYFQIKVLQMDGLGGVMNMRTFEMSRKRKQGNEQTGPFDKPFTVDNRQGVLYIPLETCDDLSPESTDQYSQENLEQLAQVLNGCEAILNRLTGDDTSTVSNENPDETY